MEGVIFNMANKRVFKLATASAVAASALVAAVPASAASVTYEQAEKQVEKAREAANGLHAEYTRNADYVTQVDSKEARDELARAKAKIAALSSAKEKAYLSSRIQGTIDTVARANAYNNAVRAGEYLGEAVEEVTAALSNGIENLATAQAAQDKLNLYYKVSQENFGKVYGKEIQANFKKEYITEDLVAFKADAYYGIATRSHLVEADKFIKANDVASAEKYLGYSKASVAKVTVEDLKDALTASWTKLSADLEAIRVPKVESVSAINAKQIVVKFNIALAEGTTDAQLLTALTLEGKTDSAAKLSDDRKSVTYTLDSAEVTNGKLTVLPLDSSKKNSSGVAVKTEEYNTVFTFEDKVAPVVAGTTFTNYSVDGKTADATITFSETLSNLGTLSINGVATAEALEAGNKSVILTGLEVGKTYRIDIVGAYDNAAAPNKAEHITVSIPVPAQVKDEVKPQVATSVSGNKVTLNFSEELKANGSVKIGGTTVAVNLASPATGVTVSADKKTVVIDAQTVGALGTAPNYLNFLNASIEVSGFGDGTNVMDTVTVNGTLYADKNAPSLVSASTKVVNGTETILLTFNEEVKDAVTTDNVLTLKVADNVYHNTAVTSAAYTYGFDVDGNGKVEGSEKNVVAITGFDYKEESTYSFELNNASVSDVYTVVGTNPYTFTVTVPKAPVTNPNPTASVEITSGAVTATNGVFVLAYDEELSDNALNASNYKLGGKVLPSNSKLIFKGDRQTVEITLPDGFVTVDGTYTLEATNVTAKTGNTLTNGKATAQVTTKENIKPFATKVELKDSKTVVVTFSEDLNGNPTKGVKVKVNGSDAASNFGTVSGNQLTITLTNDINLTDAVSVMFDTTDLADKSGNTVGNATVNK
jgi:hypothetical protein